MSEEAVEALVSTATAEDGWLSDLQHLGVAVENSLGQVSVIVDGRGSIDIDHAVEIVTVPLLKTYVTEDARDHFLEDRKYPCVCALCTMLSIFPPQVWLDELS